jgi:hypothetical protein
VDPHLQLPLTMRWNVAVERQLGANQKLTATYLGAAGRRLMQENNIYPPLLTELGKRRLCLCRTKRVTRSPGAGLLQPRKIDRPGIQRSRRSPRAQHKPGGSAAADTL